MRTLVAFFCLLPWLTLAQVPIMPGGAVPWYKKPSAASSFTPKDIPSIAYRWVWTNVSGSPVQSWQDEIRGDYFVQGTADKRPTTNSSGVYFSGDNTLVCSNFLQVLANTNAFFLLFKLDGAAVGAFRSFFMPASGYKLTVLSAGNLSAGNDLTFSSPVPNDTMTDWIFDGGDQKNYTNNILSLSGTSWFNQGYTEVGGCTPVTPDWTLKGWIAEFCVFTNTLSSTSRSNLHWYATNTFTYAP